MAYSNANILLTFELLSTYPFKAVKRFYLSQIFYQSINFNKLQFDFNSIKIKRSCFFFLFSWRHAQVYALFPCAISFPRKGPVSLSKTSETFQARKAIFDI